MKQFNDTLVNIDANFNGKVSVGGGMKENGKPHCRNLPGRLTGG